MNLIAAVDKNWAIGRKNKLLARIPNDMKQFTNKTTGKIVVMGRKTLESFPNGSPLKNRTNIVLSSNKDYSVKDTLIVHSMEELIEKLKEYPDKEIYIIGGEQIYRQFLPYCETAYITKINHAYEADAYFPDLDKLDEWEVTAESEEQIYFDLEYVFCKYEKQ